MGNKNSALGFGASSTAEDVTNGIDLRGKVYVVTGANVGIGKETARVLAQRGAHVIIGCRDEGKGKSAAADIVETTGNPLVEYLPLDLSSFESIRGFAKAFLDKQLPLNVLVNNAGIMATPWGVTKEGHEQQFGVCHLGHFLLTGLLLPKLKESAPSRVVCLSSRAHSHGDAGVLTPYTSQAGYNTWKAYGQAKLANLLFAAELNRRMEGTGVTANSVHPGVIKTELVRNNWMADVSFVVMSPFLKSIPQGAATTTFVATHPSVTTGGDYYADCQVYESSPISQDKKLAADLWTLSEKLTGISYPQSNL